MVASPEHPELNVGGKKGKNALKGVVLYRRLLY